MILDTLDTLLVSCLYFLVIGFFSSAIIYLVKPLLFLGRGPMRHPAFALHGLSLGLLHISEIRFSGLRDRVFTYSNFALCFVLLALMPLTGAFRVYFERPDILFVFFYLLMRVVFSSPLDEKAKLTRTVSDKPLLAAIVLIFLFCIFGIKKGGGAHIAEPTLHIALFSSLSSFVTFGLLFSCSSLFFLPNSTAHKGLNLITASRFMSKVIWFSMLVWIFLGTIPQQATNSFLMYAVLTTLMLVVYELICDFFPKLSAHIGVEMVKRSLIPALLFILLISWIEEKLIW